MKITFAIVLSCAFAISMAGCYNDNRTVIYPSTQDTTVTTTCDTTNVTYSGTVKEIISLNCAVSGCHDADFIAGGYNMTTYEGLLVPINSNRLIGAIKHQSGYIAMPQTGGSLSDCQINQVVAWINHGAQNN